MAIGGPNTSKAGAAGDGADSGTSALPPVAGQAADKARQAAFSQLANQKSKVTETLSTVAGSLRQAGSGMESGGQGQVAQYVQRAADQLDQFSQRINQREVEELVGDVENFARRQPAVFLGVAFAAGVAATRFLKSSSRGDSLIDRGADMARTAKATVSGEQGEAPRRSEDVAQPAHGEW